jgi:protein SCO1/2
LIRTAIFSLAFVLLAGCSRTGSKLPQYAHVPEFTMTDSAGHVFHSAELKGRVWVADFIYTNCPAECPMMTSKMRNFSKQVDASVRLVSISVDPDHDTPAALKAFASHYGGATPQWSFLTGTPETVHLLAWSTFHVGDVIGKIQHSTKFALVDQRGFIRGYYSSFDPEGMQALLRDAEALSQN